MATHWMQIAILTIVFTISGTVPGIAQSSQPQSDTYTWNGELVSLDTTAKTMTVKSRVAYQEAISELKHFKGVDRVWIVWSGIQDSSDAVRQVRRAETGRKIEENLVLPAELVSTEAPNQYLAIRIKVPESRLAAIKTMKPGEWVTVTSRHQPSSEDDAVVSVRPYGASTTTECAGSCWTTESTRVYVFSQWKKGMARRTIGGTTLDASVAVLGKWNGMYGNSRSANAINSVSE